MREDIDASAQRLLLSLKETRELLGGISMGHLRNLNKRGEIAFVRLGRRVFVPMTEIEMLLERLIDDAKVETGWRV